MLSQWRRKPEKTTANTTQRFQPIGHPRSEQAETNKTHKQKNEAYGASREMLHTKNWFQTFWKGFNCLCKKIMIIKR